MTTMNTDDVSDVDLIIRRIDIVEEKLDNVLAGLQATYDGVGNILRTFQALKEAAFANMPRILRGRLGGIINDSTGPHSE